MDTETVGMVTLEPLDHGGMTLHWDEIEVCVRQSVGADEVTVANALGALRRREMLAWAVWHGGKVGAVMLTRPMDDGYSGGRAMLIYGLHGAGVTLPMWKSAARQFENACRKSGIRKVMAHTTSDRVLEIAVELGWNTQTFCWKELD